MYLVISPSRRTCSSASPSSPASTDAVIVLPVPGGPTRRSLLRGARPCSMMRTAWRCSRITRSICSSRALLKIISRSRAFGYEVSRRLDGAPRARGTGSAGPLSSDRAWCPFLASSTRARNSTASLPWPSFASCAATCMATERNRSSSPLMCDLSSALICSALAIGHQLYCRTAWLKRGRPSLLRRRRG